MGMLSDLFSQLQGGAGLGGVFGHHGGGGGWSGDMSSLGTGSGVGGSGSNLGNGVGNPGSSGFGEITNPAPTDGTAWSNGAGQFTGGGGGNNEWWRSVIRPRFPWR
jgi:hypothetical protein